MRNSKNSFRLLAVGSLLLLLLSTSAGIGSTTASGAEASTSVQESHSDSHAGHQSGGLLEPVVDGATNPGLIPNDAARRSLLLAIMVSPNPDEEELAQLRLKTGRMNLNESDTEILIRGLGNFHTLATFQIARIDRRRDTAKISANATTFGWFMQEDNKLNRLAELAYNKMLRELSADGRAKLRDHLEYAKTRMKIYPPPTMRGRN